MKTERFEMRLTGADRSLLDSLRGPSTGSAYLLGLLRREGRRQRAAVDAVTSDEEPERDLMGSSGDLGPGMDPE